MKPFEKEYQKWLTSDIVDENTKAELQSIKDDEIEIESRFSSPMAFGTAGLRSKMKAGIACMNRYTVAHTTTGLAKLICDGGEEYKKRGVAIAYDSRNNSYEFAQITAEVLAAHGIKVYFFKSLRPTPVLSFTILYLKCIAGVNITASHNTKEYNGYKAYWEDGAQLPPEHAKTVSEATAAIDIFKDVTFMPFEEGVKKGLISVIGDGEKLGEIDIDEEYINAVLKCRISIDEMKKYGDSLNIIYTPLHGAGTVMIPETLKRAGITNLRVVESQRVPDGNFPTVKSPNPENRECFNEAFKLNEASGNTAELIIASDPDADRMGATLKCRDGSYVTLTGNQIGVLMTDYIIKGRKAANALPANAAAIKSVVSTNMFEAVCKAGGIKPVKVLTGFKYIGEKMKEYEKTGKQTFLFGFEESFGFLPGPHARDKDAVAASLIFAEMAAFYKAQGKSLYDVLYELYEQFGYYRENTVSYVIDGIDPMKKMKDIMSGLRNDPPKEIAGVKIKEITDYTGKTDLPYADMLSYSLEDGTTVLVRPSGTEPKIKVYVLTLGKTAEESENNVKKYSEYKLF